MTPIKFFPVFASLILIAVHLAQLERLNEQVQEKIEKAILDDLLEQEKKKVLPIVARVPKVMRRKKVKRRRPGTGPVKKVDKEDTPFSTFGNGQSRFGLGG